MNNTLLYLLGGAAAIGLGVYAYKKRGGQVLTASLPGAYYSPQPVDTKTKDPVYTQPVLVATDPLSNVLIDQVKEEPKTFTNLLTQVVLPLVQPVVQPTPTIQPVTSTNIYTTSLKTVEPVIKSSSGGGTNFAPNEKITEYLKGMNGFKLY